MATRSVNNTPVNANANALSPLGTAKPGEASKTAATKAPVAAAAAGAAGGSDGKKGASAVALSSGGKERAEAMQKAYDIAKNTPDVREDRVAAIKAQIANGTYQIDAGKVADGMMREAIREHLADSEER